MKVKRLLILPTLLVASASLVGCKGNATEIDYVHNGSVKLTLDYKGKNFYEDGIGQVTLKTHIDGDTAHFTPKGFTGDTIKSRFYGIDTPESTGKIQEWGKPASEFTKSKLQSAKTIVVGSPSLTYCKPTPDSTGSRYVSLIWINEEKEDAPYDELYLLNLWIVQEGFSWVKSLEDMPSLTETFIAAENQAKAFKKHLHSDEKDPTFNYGDYTDVSLQELQTEMRACIQDPEHVNKYSGAKVRVYGAVAGYANKILYLQDYYPNDKEKPQEGGEYAGINIFTGMSTIPTKFTKRNAYIQVCGTAVDSENFGFQLSGASFPTVAYDDNDAKVVYKPEDNVEWHKLVQFKRTTAELNASIANKTLSELNCAVTMGDAETGEKLKCTKAYKSEDGDFSLTMETLDGTKASFTVFITFLYKGGYPETFDTDDYVGSTFVVNSGVFTSRKGTDGKYRYSLSPSSDDDFICISKAEKQVDKCNDFIYK